MVFNQHKIKANNIALCLKQLATLIESGLPVVESLETIERNLKNNALIHLMSNIKNTVQNGNPLSDALQQYPKHFDPLTCQLVYAGEQSGTLNIMLNHLTIYHEKIKKIKSNIKKALLYPIIVLVISTLVTSILLIFVVPQFSTLFEGFGAQLPFLTQCVIKASDFLQSFWYILLLASFTPIFLIIQFKKRNDRFAIVCDQLILKLPVFGFMIQQSIITKLMRTLATTFSSGMPLLDALSIMTNITNHHSFKNALADIRQSVTEGQVLSQCLYATNLFPAMTIQMVAIGEEVGKLSTMLERIANIYEDELDQKIENINQLIEPLIMSCLGLIIGGLVIAMYLPIFKLGTIV